MRRILLLLALPLVLSACDIIRSEDFSLPGTYLLVSVDGTSPPTTIVDEPERTVQLWGLTLRLTSEGIYRSRLHLRVTEGESSTLLTVDSRGEFRREGGSLHLERGTIEGDRSILEILDGHALREVTDIQRKVLHYERVTPRP